MRVPLTKYGLREIILGSVLCLGAVAVCIWLFPPGVVVPVLAWICLLSFFRDPDRPGDGAPHELLSPADGVIMDIQEVDPPAFLDGRAVRVGGFMSVFEVHVNRAPMAGTVRYLERFPGKFRNARDARSRTENEHNLIGLELADGRRILVNQIAGVIARRIVCAVRPGDRLARGQRLGMVKFGSRVELFVPQADSPVVRVRVGDKVKGGRDVLAAYERRRPQN